MKKLTIVIVSYNVRHYLEQCIDSVLRAAHDIDHEIYVVDNASTDDTVSVVRQRFAHQVTLIESPTNLGFARANNMAIRQTESEYVLLLNPDTFVAEDSFSQVLSFMDSHPKAGGVGVMMHNVDGTRAPESRRGMPTPWVALLKMTGHSRRYYLSHLPWEQPCRIEVISGAFCMLRREALNNVGLLDEDFFMYGEDIDLSYRLLKGGYENWYVPARILHYKGESTQKSSYRYVHTFYQAMIIFFRKHYGHLSFLITAPIKLAIYGRAFVALVQMQYARMRASLGFGEQPGADTPYYFTGAEQMLGECDLLVRQKGLQGQRGVPAGQLLPGACIVYDTGHYTYGQILDSAAARPAHDAMIGTYNPETKTIITVKCILK